MLRCIWRNRGTRWFTMMISGSRPSPHTHGGPTVLSSVCLPGNLDRFARTVRNRYRQTGSTTSRPKISTMQKPPKCRLQQKTSQSGDPERWTHISTKLHRGRLSPAVCKGGGGFELSPWDPKGGKKKLLSLWLVRKSGRKNCAELRRGFS